MKPAPFNYVRPKTVDEVLRLLSQHGSDAHILAGGQSLIAMLNMRIATPGLLIDISDVEQANYIRTERETVAVGCATRQIELERWPGLHKHLALVSQALPWIGHIQTRSRGTVCGSIAHADPSSELPLCLALLNGEVVLRNARQTRALPAKEFFLGPLQTERQPDELISEIRLPLQSGSVGSAFNEMAIRHGDFAIIAVAVVADQNGIDIGIGGGANRPVTHRLPIISGDDLGDALNDLAWSLDCQDDLHATAAYRRHLVRALGERTIKEALACQS